MDGQFEDDNGSVGYDFSHSYFIFSITFERKTLAKGGEKL